MSREIRGNAAPISPCNGSADEPEVLAGFGPVQLSALRTFGISAIIPIDRVDFDNLQVHDPKTLYLIRG